MFQLLWIQIPVFDKKRIELKMYTCISVLLCTLYTDDLIKYIDR